MPNKSKRNKKESTPEKLDPLRPTKTKRKWWKILQSEPLYIHDEKNRIILHGDVGAILGSIIILLIVFILLWYFGINPMTWKGIHGKP